VQAFPSLQVVPFAFTGFEQAPPAQVPALWHVSMALHTMGAPPPHEPLLQVSPAVHPFPSLHAVPFALTGLLHTPALQVPAT
jgi:hypothetical protein